MSTKHDNLINIATKRGFFFPTAEYYGAKAGFWTYGHLGTIVKSKWQNLWREHFLSLNDNYYEIEGSYILPKEVFIASGHLKNFNDLLTECKKCHFKFKADHLIEDVLKINAAILKPEDMDRIIKENQIKCPKCGNQDFEKVRVFNMMFDVKIGAIGEEIAYLLPETAQNPYLSFKREFYALREKLPMGLAMIGKAFRNEISPRQGFFRLREFTQAELQIFFDKDNIDACNEWKEVSNYKIILIRDKEKNVNEISCNELNTKLKLPKFYVYNMAKVQQFYLDLLKIPKNKFRFRELNPEERAFYNKIHFDIELELETLGGFKECGGVHYRADHDLLGHQETSKEKLEVTVDNKKILPNVLELSFGVDRNIWALLDIFYKEDKETSIFTFPSIISPYNVAVFPLVSNDVKIVKKSKEVYNMLKKDFNAFFDLSGSIGRRYARQDEVGTNFGITVDFDSLKKEDITIRNRDNKKQIRVKIKKLKETLNSLLSNEIKFEKAGKLI